MTADLLDPPELFLSAESFERRRAHLLAEVDMGQRRRRWALLGPVAAVAAVVVALLLGGRPASPRLTLVDQALAAIGSGSTLHVVLEIPSSAQLLDTKTGKLRSLPTREEFWADSKRRTIFIRRLDGRIAQRLDFPRDAWGVVAAAWRPFVTGYKQELQEGTFHVVRRGRLVEWIGNGKGEEIAISRTTYRPLAIRYARNGRQLDARVVLAESATRLPTRFAHVKPTGGFGGGQTAFAGSATGIPTTVAAARAAMSPDPLVPSTTIASLKRTWIGFPDYLRPPGSSYRDQVNGLTLYYGRLDAYGYPRWSGRYVAINEIPNRRDAEAIWGPAFFREDGAVISTPISGRETVATIELHGLYVAIQASDRATAIAAMQALVR